MKFYDREEELKILHEVQEQSFGDHSRFTVVTGRRRVGKTKLILKSCEGQPTVYLFVARKNEGELCNKFAQVISRSLDMHFPEGSGTFADVFASLMELGRYRSFNLVIDEFQEFFYINESVFSEMQDIWDRYKDETHVNLIVSGSVYTLMYRIFKDAREPLYGRADRNLKVMPFTTSVLKEVLADFSPDYTPDDLLALYTFTGGVPKYVELLMEAGAYDMQAMVDFMIRPGSFFLDEGDFLLIQEFGKKYGNYYSILASIASGRNTMADILALFTGGSIGGQIKRLEEDYAVIGRKRPVLSKEGTQNVRYEIADNFLRFWFRYINRNRDFIETGNLHGLAELIKADYPTYSGWVLERYFRQQLSEQMLYRNIGSWWETSKGKGGAQNEVDIVAIHADGKRVLIGEVKRQRKNFKPELLQQKAEYLRTRLFNKYEIETRCFTLEDM
ncbi:MAG: ATP-binding protein [Parabacteroides sp.]|nr:ATP-binding protein [Parabacteroides sp.]